MCLMENKNTFKNFNRIFPEKEAFVLYQNKVTNYLVGIVHFPFYTKCRQ